MGWTGHLNALIYFLFDLRMQREQGARAADACGKVGLKRRQMAILIA